MVQSIEQAEAEVSSGMSHVRSGDIASAVESFRRAVAADPQHAGAFNNLGVALATLGHHQEAVEAFRGVLQIDANNTQAIVNLGDSQRALGADEEALRCFARALDIDPNYGPAYYSLGQANQALGRLNEALACYLRAMDLRPQDGDIVTALGGVLMQLRLADEARQAFERALAIDPTMGVARAHLIHLLARDCDWDGLEAHQDWVERLGIEGDVVPPFNLLAFEDEPERHRVRSERFAEASYSRAAPLPVPARPSTRPDRLRIGYFSADFREHATMFLAARMFELHDRGRFSIHAYSYGREEPGAMRERALAAFEEFRDVRSFGDRAIAEMARADGIDIAVDLKGYTEHQRVGIFAHRPAPIQISFLGYPGTLGAPFMDYLVADRVVAPSDQRHAYAEHLIVLPHSYQVNDNTRAVPDARQTRTELGLPQEGFVFCCFNNSYKIKPAEFGIWMDLLKKVEGSVLWLLATNARVESNLRTAARMRGVDPDRLVFAQRVAPAAHLARQRFADLFLDTFNCNAHTTASDALWAGVPLVTKAGKGFAARVAASLLNAMGLTELITGREQDYAELARSLAEDPSRLAAIRVKLEANRLAAPLFDSELFTRHMELAYDQVYQRYVEGHEPADITVAPIRNSNLQNEQGDGNFDVA